jgi:hypothetical protein
MRIGGCHVELPVIIHRMLPAEADVTDARLVVERVAASRRVRLNVTAKIPDPELAETGPTIAVHGGWRHEEDGGIRVATWRADHPVAIPSHLHLLVRRESDRSGIIVLPVDCIRRQETADRLRSGRDHAIDRMREQLVAWLGAHPPKEGEYPTGAEVSRWRAPRRFAQLALAWRDDPPACGAGVAAELENWRRFDRKLWERQEHGRRKQLARRDDAWRKVAAWLARTAGRIVIDDTDYGRLARAAATAEEQSNIPAEIIAARARQRIHASPQGLRGAITAAADRRGALITTVTSRDLSRQHTCGHVHSEMPRTHEVLCHGCGDTYDRDANAVALMLTRASSKNDPPPTASAGTAA